MPSLTVGSSEVILHFFDRYQAISGKTPDASAIWTEISAYADDGGEYQFYAGCAYSPERPDGYYYEDISALLRAGDLEWVDGEGVRVSALGQFSAFGRTVPDCLKPLEERVIALAEKARTT